MEKYMFFSKNSTHTGTSKSVKCWGCSNEIIGCGTVLSFRNIGEAKDNILPISRNIGGNIEPPVPHPTPVLAPLQYDYPFTR